MTRARILAGATARRAGGRGPVSGALLGLALVVGFGCARQTYLTPTHGRAYAEAFGHQTVNPNPIPTDGRDTQGLDSQEATAVARSYRRSLGANDSGEAGAAPMVIMSPGAGQPAAPYTPAPSVP
jgi:hypothetical protein